MSISIPYALNTSFLQTASQPYSSLVFTSCGKEPLARKQGIAGISWVQHFMLALYICISQEISLCLTMAAKICANSEIPNIMTHIDLRVN